MADHAKLLQKIITSGANPLLSVDWVKTEDGGEYVFVTSDKLKRMQENCKSVSPAGAVASYLVAIAKKISMGKAEVYGNGERLSSKMPKNEAGPTGDGWYITSGAEGEAEKV